MPLSDSNPPQRLRIRASTSTTDEAKRADEEREAQNDADKWYEESEAKLSQKAREAETVRK